ncbi:tyrosine-type recombinase/integrase [Bacteroidota bacterium]
MFLNKRSNGFYYVHYKDEYSKWKSISTKTRQKSVANKYFASLKTNVSNQTRQSASLSEFLIYYKEYSLSNHAISTTIRNEYVTDRLIDFLGDVPLRSITAKDIERYKTERLKKIKATTMNIDLRSIKAILNKAVDWEYISSNPIRRVSMVRIPSSAPVFLSEADVKVLLNNISLPWLKNMIIFAVYTGMRRGEIINLKWEHLDFENKLVIVKNTKDFSTKNKSERVIPLNDVLLKELKYLARHNEYVFTNTFGQMLTPDYVSQCFRDAVRKSGLRNEIHFHSLRHTFASWLVQKQVPIYTVSKLLGHSNVKVTEIYSHLTNDALRASMERIAINYN